MCTLCDACAPSPLSLSAFPERERVVRACVSGGGGKGENFVAGAPLSGPRTMWSGEFSFARLEKANCTQPARASIGASVCGCRVC